MRVLALSILLVAGTVLAADTARAQTSIPNTFSETVSDLPPDQGYWYDLASYRADLFVDLPEYRESSMGAYRSGGTTFLPVGGRMLVSQSSSYYPVANTKLRYESLFLADRIDDRTALMIGAWRYKHQIEGLPGLRTGVTYGISWTTSF